MRSAGRRWYASPATGQRGDVRGSALARGDPRRRARVRHLTAIVDDGRLLAPTIWRWRRLRVDRPPLDVLPAPGYSGSAFKPRPRPPARCRASSEPFPLSSGSAAPGSSRALTSAHDTASIPQRHLDTARSRAVVARSLLESGRPGLPTSLAHGRYDMKATTTRLAVLMALGLSAAACGSDGVLGPKHRAHRHLSRERRLEQRALLCSRSNRRIGWRHLRELLQQQRRDLPCAGLGLRDPHLGTAGR